MREDGTDEGVGLDVVAVGDRLRVRPGEKVPVDGELIDGRSCVDESMIMGESMPVTKETGAKLIGGTLNQSGGFVMRAVEVGHDTMLARIVRMVAEAQRSRAPIQRPDRAINACCVNLNCALGQIQAAYANLFHGRNGSGTTILARRCR